MPIPIPSQFSFPISPLTLPHSLPNPSYEWALEGNENGLRRDGEMGEKHTLALSLGWANTPSTPHLVSDTTMSFLSSPLSSLHSLLSLSPISTTLVSSPHFSLPLLKHTFMLFQYSFLHPSPTNFLV